MAEAARSAPYEAMSPTLLAAQPVNDNQQRPKENSDWGVIFNHLEARFGWLRMWRYSWWSYWAQIALYFLPRRYHWVIVANRMSRGSPVNDAIKDGTATLALQTCARGMWSGLTNPTRPWLKLGAHGASDNDVDAEAKFWLEDTEQVLYRIMDGSNFYPEFAQAFEDLTAFGTAPLLIYEDYEDVIRLYSPCAGEYFLGVGSRLSVDTFNREFNFTVLQLVEMFKVENCPEEVRNLWTQGGAALDTEFVVRHSIEPNFPIASRSGKTGEVRPLPAMFTFREFYWLAGKKSAAPLSRKGFDSKPFIAMRWSKVSNDAYGRGPCMDALGDNKQVQQETVRKAEYIEKGVRPSMGAKPAMKNEPATVAPAQITYMTDKESFWPLFEINPVWLSGLTADIDKVNARIEKCLFVPVFMAITQMAGVQPRNELELTKRDLERLQALGPVINLVEGELQLAIMRIIEIAEKRRLLKPRPKSLASRALKIEFVTIMRLAQRSAESVAIKDFSTTLGELSSAAQAAKVPDPIREVKLGRMARRYADVSNVPSDIWYSEEEVSQHDAARAKAVQQAQVPGQAMAAVQAAKTLADTQTGGGTALSALTGGGSGAAPSPLP